MPKGCLKQVIVELISGFQVSRLLMVVESGSLNKWKGQSLKDTNPEGNCNCIGTITILT